MGERSMSMMNAVTARTLGARRGGELNESAVCDLSAERSR
jgi:hypothetical protein